MGKKREKVLLLPPTREEKRRDPKRRRLEGDMAGRNYISHPLAIERSPDFRDGPPPRRPVPVHPSEEELALRHDEICRLHADNQLLIDENVVLRREVTFTKG